MVCAVTAEWVGGSPHPYCSVSVTNVEAQVLKWVMTNVEILNIQGSQMLRLYCICTAMYVGRPADRQQCVCACVSCGNRTVLSVAVSLVPGCT